MLVDTNIIVRTLQPHHPLYRIADGALKALRSQNRRLFLAPQNLIELWTVATRPSEANGIGLSVSAAQAEIERLEKFFTVLRETPALYPAWKRLVFDSQVSGKQTYDARLVAAMQVHSITSILTFNATDFRRYVDIEVVDPAAVVGA